MFGMRTTVRQRGPWFDGRANRIIRDFADDAETEIAERGEDMVHARLHRVLKHPTGYYESQVRMRKVGSLVEITDGGVVYGPWLEGTSSRNRTTRFKGYATFRKVGTELDRRSNGIAERLLRQRYLWRLR